MISRDLKSSTSQDAVARLHIHLLWIDRMRLPAIPSVLSVSVAFATQGRRQTDDQYSPPSEIVAPAPA
jgi:hypothetical protein